MSRPARLLVVVAHPDDESFGVGGTMAMAVDRGVEVRVLIATRGQAGQIVLPELDTPANRADLGSLREAEARAAMAALSVPRVDFLEHRDGRLRRVPEVELAAEIATVVREARPDAMVTFGPEGIYGHPDHVAIHHAATRAFHLAADSERSLPGGPAHAVTRLLYNVIPESLAELLNHEMGPIDLEGGGHPFVGYAEAEIACRVDIGPVLSRKMAALAAHRSQTGGDALAIAERLGDRVAREQFLLACDRGEGHPHLADDPMAGLPGPGIA